MILQVCTYVHICVCFHVNDSKGNARLQGQFNGFHDSLSLSIVLRMITCFHTKRYRKRKKKKKKRIEIFERYSIVYVYAS